MSDFSIRKKETEDLDEIISQPPVLVLLELPLED